MRELTLRRATAVAAAADARSALAHARLWLLAVAAVTGIGSVGYMLIEGWSLSDAVYMTAITLTTVGYREVGELSDLGRAWTIALAASGVGLLFGFVGIVGESIVAEATSGRREAQRIRDQVARLRDHIVLCGYGRVGSTVARQLHAARQPLVVIDILPESIERARADGYLVVEGDATEDVTLREAGIDHARGLITTIDSDALNVYVILSARALNPRLLIAGRAATASAEGKLKQAGADQVVSPYTMAGLRLAQLAVRPRVVEFIDSALEHGELAFSIEQIDVSAGGQIDGRTVAEVRRRGVHVLGIGHAGGGYETDPTDERILRAGETLIVSGAREVLHALGRHGEGEGT